MQTISHELLEKRFQSVAGLATLDATDRFFFLNCLNSRLRDAWDRVDWPELIQLVELPVSSDSIASNTTDVVSYDVLEAWNRNPYTDRQASKVEYRIINSKIVLSTAYDKSSIFVLAKKEFNDYDFGATDIPRFLENYLISACLADFFRGDGQTEKASIEEARAEEFLLRQMDRVEKLQQQNQPGVSVYPINQSQTMIYQN